MAKQLRSFSNIWECLLSMKSSGITEFYDALGGYPFSYFHWGDRKYGADPHNGNEL